MRVVLIQALFVSILIGCGQSGLDNQTSMQRIADDPQPVISVEDFGAIADDGIDDTAAIQMAIDSNDSGTLYFPPGNYTHDDVIYVRNKENFRLRGDLAELTSTNTDRQAIIIENSNGVELLDMIISAPFAVTRKSTFEHMGISVLSSSDVKIIGNTVNGSSAAGIIISRGTNNYRIENNLVQNTLADGIHNTGRAHNGMVIDNVTRNTGDDGIAVVSYVENNDYTQNIKIVNNLIDGTPWGRGITVVGGKDIEIRNNSVKDVNAAGILVASENSYNTYGAKNIRIIDNWVTHPNTGEIDHGGIYIYSRAGVVPHIAGEVTLQHEDILVQGNIVDETVYGPAHFRLRTDNVYRVNVINNDFNDADESKKAVSIGKESDRYNFIDNRYNGIPLSDHVGDVSIQP